MKAATKLICVLLAVCALLGLLAGCGDRSADDPTDATPATDTTEVTEVTEATEPTEDVLEQVDFIVEVESDRDPIVLQLSDPQIIDSSQVASGSFVPELTEYWGGDKLDIRCFDYIRETVQATNPDLILITGDLVFGNYDPTGSSLLALIACMEEFQIPWAPVFGNHDNESAMGVDWQCQQLEQAEHCLFKQRTLTGNGNYTVGIKQGDDLKRVFFMMDSNGCSQARNANDHTSTQAGFGEDQVAWYTKTARKIKELSPDTKLTFAFHIQISAFIKAYAQYGFTNSGTKNAPINIDTHPDKAAGDFGYLGADLKGPWDTDGKVMYGLRMLGVDSILVGHEHCNSASVVYEGVRFQFGQKISTYDRANFLLDDGSIIGVYPPTEGEPLMGGTVMPLDKEDGSIKDPYIYLCNGLGTSNE